MRDLDRELTTEEKQGASPESEASRAIGPTSVQVNAGCKPSQKSCIDRRVSEEGSVRPRRPASEFCAYWVLINKSCVSGSDAVTNRPVGNGRRV